MITPFQAYNTMTGKPVVVTVSGIDPEVKSTAAIDAVLESRDPGFVRVIGFAVPGGRLMSRSGETIDTVALVATENYDGKKTVEWVELDDLQTVQQKGEALLAEKAEASARHLAKQEADRGAAAVREAASLAVVPEEYRAEWLAAVEAKRTSYRLNPLASHDIRAGDGMVSKNADGTYYWDRTKVAAYDPGGSGYGRHAD